MTDTATGEPVALADLPRAERRETTEHLWLKRWEAQVAERWATPVLRADAEVHTREVVEELVQVMAVAAAIISGIREGCDDGCEPEKRREV